MVVLYPYDFERLCVGCGVSGIWEAFLVFSFVAVVVVVVVVVVSHPLRCTALPDLPFVSLNEKIVVTATRRADM